LNRNLWLTLDHFLLRTFFFNTYHILAVFSFYSSIEDLKPRVLLLLWSR